jgi:hypothetical protein
MNEHRDNAKVLLEEIRADKKSAELRIQSYAVVTEYVQQLERAMRANMPQQIADLMAYSTGTSGGGR